jgi:hypothetical protein
MYLDMGFMVIFAFGATVILSRVRTITRTEGTLLLGSYVGFIGLLVLQVT